jgi:hypothetical protein
MRVFTLTASNGGEGGIGVAAQFLFEIACGDPSSLRSVELRSHPFPLSRMY